MQQGNGNENQTEGYEDEGEVRRYVVQPVWGRGGRHGVDSGNL